MLILRHNRILPQSRRNLFLKGSTNLNIKMKNCRRAQQGRKFQCTLIYILQHFNFENMLNWEEGTTKILDEGREL